MMGSLKAVLAMLLGGVGVWAMLEVLDRYVDSDWVVLIPVVVVLVFVVVVGYEKKDGEDG